MNCYSAHLSKAKKNIYIYIYFIQPDLIVSIFYSFYQIRSFFHSHSHSLSFISHSSQAPLSQRRRHRQAHSSTVQLASSFFFFLFSFYQIRSHSLSFTLSRSLSSLISSLSNSLSQRRWPGLTLSTPITDPQSSPSIGVPDWETHGARR